jgi:hypothetical protein
MRLQFGFLLGEYFTFIPSPGTRFGYFIVVCYLSMGS